MSQGPETSARALAAHYLQIGQPERTLAQLERVGSDDLEDPAVWELRGWALVGLDRDVDAASVASDGLSRWPENVELLRVLTAARAATGELAEAEDAILRALRLEPDDPVCLCQYAEALMRGGQLGKAEQVLDLAARADPDEIVVLRTRLTLAYLRADKREARRLSAELLARDADDRQAHVMLGGLDFDRARPGSALERFSTAVRRDPSDHAVGRAARSAQVMRSPLAWPLLPFQRFGPGPTWIAAVATIFGLQAVGLDTASFVAAMVWIVLCVYSWIATPFLERRAERW